MTKKRILDVRGLACPEPAEAVLEAVTTLASGHYLEVIHDQEPKLLYPHLKKRGFSFLTQKGDEPVIRVLIWREQDREARSAVDEAVRELS